MPHQSQIIRVREAADGILAVTVRCCGDKKTDSVLTINNLSRGTDAIDADIAKHQKRVEQLHADKKAATEHIQRLSGVKADCGCR